MIQMKHFIIEIKDERDKDNPEPWSHFDHARGGIELTEKLSELVLYLQKYPVVEVRIRVQ